MKKVLFVLPLFILVFISCNKKYRFYGFDINESINVPIPIDVFEIDSVFTIDLYIDNIFETHDTKAELVENISIEEVSVDGVGYNNFSELKIKISTENQPEILLAKNDTIDYDYDFLTGTYKVKLNETETLMDRYVKESKINIRVIGGMPMPLNIPSTARINIRFRVLTYVK